MPVAQPRIQVAAATKQPKVYRPIGLVAEVALPAASGLQPVLRAQGRPQQRDGQAADEKGHKYQRSLLEIHGYVYEGQGLGKRVSPIWFTRLPPYLSHHAAQFMFFYMVLIQ